MSAPVPDATDYPAASFVQSALAFIEAKIPDVDAMSAMLNQRVNDSGNLYDVMDIAWRMLPSMAHDFAAATPGADNVLAQPDVTTATFYSHPDAHKDWPHFALHEIALKASKVLSIYAGFSERVPLPGGDYPANPPGLPPPPFEAV